MVESEQLSVNRKFLPLYARDLPPSPIVLVSHAYTKYFEDIIHDKWETLIQTIENGYSTWYFGEQDLKRLGKRTLELCRQDNEFLLKLNKKFLTLVNKFLLKTKKFKKNSYAKISNKQLSRMLNEYCGEYEIVSAYGEIVPFCLEVALTEKLKAYLEKKFVGISKEDRDMIFAALSAFPDISFVAEEELDLYKLAIKPKNRRKNLLKKHYQKYLWVPFDYVGPEWTMDYFESRLNEIIKMPKRKITAKINELKSKSEKLKNEQRTIIKKYNIETEAALEFKFLQQSGWQFDQKKEYLTQSHYHLSYLLKEIAERLKINFSLIYYALPNELIELLGNKKNISNSLLESRKKDSFLISRNGESKFLNKDERKKWLPYIEVKKEKDDAKKIKKEVRGMVAYRGEVEAEASIILTSRHIGDMKKGSVLITPMTSVDFVPAMRLASAIVTDLGGITSHAAIISRELKIPCVVGTKKATKIFKHGDRVKVDGSKGIVKLSA